MSRKKLLAQESSTSEKLATDQIRAVSSLIQSERLVPIVSNSVFNNAVFDIDADSRVGISRDMDAEEYIDRGCQEYALKIDEQLAKKWAVSIGYPLVERSLQLSRVAQYCQVKSGGYQAKIRYLSFLKWYLLELAQHDKGDKKVQDALKLFRAPLIDPSTGEVKLSHRVETLLRRWDFAELVSELGYPKFKDKEQNPLHLLAQLPLPIYVTTSHHDFIERALFDVRKYPRTVICDWFGEHKEMEWFCEPPPRNEDVAPGRELDAGDDADVVSPVVYHLYGLEKEPGTIVVSEDDYLDFLVRVCRDKDDIDTFPTKLREALGKSFASMLLVGYTLRGWDFRALFRGIIWPTIRTKRTGMSKEIHFTVLLNPPYRRLEEDEEATQDCLEEAQQYFEDYLDPIRFKVVWDNETHFLKELLQEWRASQ